MVKRFFAVLFLAAPLLAQSPGVSIGEIAVEAGADEASTAAWQAALERATRERKPILAFEKPPRCLRQCATFEQEMLAHPAVQRRLSNVVLVMRPVVAPAESPVADLVLFDRLGRELVRLGGLPRDATALASMLDGIVSAAPNVELAAQLTETKGPYEGDLELATALFLLGRHDEARATIQRAATKGSEETRELAIVAQALLDANGPKRAEALARLHELVSNAATPAGRETAVSALALLQPAASGTTHASAAVRILPPAEQIVTGKHTLRTSVSSAAVARVHFFIEGKERAQVERPPFATTIDFGRIPETQTVRAVAFDTKGKEIGRDELTINQAGDMFWIRLIEPREGQATGTVRVTTTMRAPASRNVRRVVVSWNDAERAVIAGPPWQTEVRIPAELGILRAVAELDDGRTSEDAVLLNTSGYVEHSDVPFVEIPVTVTADGAPARITAADVAVREGKKKRTIESVISGTDAPLTVGLVIDTSGSMYKNLLDVQEAAIRFLGATLSRNDRAFLVTFDTSARLAQTATSDTTLLRKQIMALRTQGDTALYDAMILGLLQFEGIKGRRAMIVFSDGDDRMSRYAAADVEELARRSNIPIYFIAAPPEARPFANTATNGAGGDTFVMEMGALAKATRASGGATHFLRNLGQLRQVYESIEEDLRAQSLIVIRTDPGRSENDWRTIAVDVSGRGRHVRAPAGYYAPW